ncbi:SpoIIE family protein phosphatase [bacterium AH-315-C07]|nr:SpoIIE family protein phosphatase [bacterium AH-315-C07]
MIQDSRGYLWFGTSGGVSRYDGADFTNYTTSEGLAGNAIQCIFEDSQGNIWLGTEAGVSRLSPLSDAVFKIDNYSSEQGLQSSSIKEIIEDQEGNLWFATNGYGIAFLSKEKISIDPSSLEQGDNLFTYITDKVGLVHNRAYSMFKDEKGNIWVGAFKHGLSFFPASSLSDVIAGKFNKNLFKSNHATEAFNESNKSINASTGEYEVSNTIYDILAENGRLWLGSQRGLYLCWGENMKNFVKISELNGQLVRTVCMDHKGNLWLGVYGGGVARISKSELDKQSEKMKVERFTVKEGLISNLVIPIIEDREKNMWFGTDENGVSMFSGYVFRAFTVDHGLKNDLVLSIVQDDRNNFIFGSFGGGITYFIPNANTSIIENKLDPIQIQSGALYNLDEASGLLNDNIYQVMNGSSGNYWVSNFSKGIIKYPTKEYGGDFGVVALNGKKLAQYYSTDNGLLYNGVFSMVESSTGDLWFGTAAGLCRHKPSENSNNLVFQNYQIENGLASNFVYAIYEDRAGTIWVGAKGGGFSKYIPGKDVDETSRSFVSYTSDEGLVNNSVRSFTEDWRGNLIVGTNGGVSVFNKDHKATPESFTNFTTKDGIASDDVYALIFDNDSNLWVGSSKGLDKIDYPLFLKSGKISTKHYGKQEGFTGGEVGLNSVYKDNNGHLWFGTLGGAIEYDPSQDEPNTQEPLTQITRIRISTRDTLLNQNAVLSYDKNNIRFDFVGVSLSVPEKVQYQFMLEGFDKTWLPVTQEQFAIYSNLSAGEYKFKVKASNNEGIWNERPVVQAFSITPPFWKTWWFYLVCTVTIGFAILQFIKMRLQALESAKKELEEKVEERTAELNEKNGELAQKNKDIIDSIKYAKRIQEAILPLREDIYESLPHSFILYKPKDIVSGDFYWFANLGVNGDNISIIAAVDCTGHGVPGAFMSMIGNELLNQIIIKNHITVPGTILTHLHNGVRNALKQTGEAETATKDGMDIGLCAINYKKREVQFAGAFRPMLILRKGEFEEIRGDRYSIGGFQKESERVFTNNEIKLEKDEVVYIFSDGCIDQFGGKRNKKFMSRRLRELLVSCDGLSMHHKSNKIEKTLMDWKGDYEQTDDILMIGVRF